MAYLEFMSQDSKYVNYGVTYQIDEGEVEIKKLEWISYDEMGGHIQTVELKDFNNDIKNVAYEEIDFEISQERSSRRVEGY